MKTLTALKSFTHYFVGSVDKGQEFQCDTKIASELVKQKLAKEVKEPKAADEKK